MTFARRDPDEAAPRRFGTEAVAPPLFVVRGDATPEEVAALTVVLQSLTAATPAAPAPRRRPEWNAPHRLVRTALTRGWRRSALPR